MIKYIGSKRVLVPTIVEMVSECDGVRSVFDLFSGTSRVGRALKAEGYFVESNDLNSYAHAIATCYVQADATKWRGPATQLIEELAAVAAAADHGDAGYFTDTFCHKARYVHPDNGVRVDAVRRAIASKDLPTELEAIALVSLMEATDRVDSTTGVQMAYLKKWASRALNSLELRVPELVPGEGRAHLDDAVERAERGEVSADLVYLDPPYNQHSYLGNYHVWETLVRWDAPEAYGVAQKRVDVKERKSDFNSKRRCMDAMSRLVRHIDARWLLVSFNNEGFIDRDAMVELLSSRGPVEVIERPFERYVGAKIGIYNPSGEKVGKISHTENKEYLFRVRVEVPAATGVDPAPPLGTSAG